MARLGMAVSKRFLKFFYFLIFFTIGLMALGAGVRTMNAGLSCPDWPLCFGQVIPDFHVGVWFEFVHRAWAGLVAIFFFGALVHLLRNKRVSPVVKRLGIFALIVLLTQIIMGGLTVLKLLKVSVVTSHLMLATVFVATMFIMACLLAPEQIQRARTESPRWLLPFAAFLSLATFLQIWLGGMVASSYAGAVCVDFPLCNGQWVPTLKGPIGLQVMHRFGAYALVLMATGLFVFAYRNRAANWMTSQLLRMMVLLGGLIWLQLGIGIANLVFYIPPKLTVLHQSVAIMILLTSLRLTYIAQMAVARVKSPSAHPAGFEAQPPRILA